MKLESISALIRGGIPVFLEGPSGAGKTAFLKAMRSILAHPDLFVYIPAGSVDAAEMNGMVYMNPYILDEEDLPTPTILARYSIEKAYRAYERLKNEPIPPGKYAKVLIFLDELTNTRNKQAFQAQLTGDGTWAGRNLGKPWIVAAGNSPEESDSADYLGNALLSRFIRIKWSYDKEYFFSYSVGTVMHNALKSILQDKYPDLSLDNELFLELFIDWIEQSVRELRSKVAFRPFMEALKFLKGSAKNEFVVPGWPIPEMPPDAEITRYRRMVYASLAPYIKERLGQDINRLAPKISSESNQPFFTPRTATWAIDAAAIIAATHKSLTHPDIQEAIEGAIGPELGRIFASQITNANLPSFTEIKQWLTGAARPQMESLSELLKDPSFAFSFAGRLAEVARSVLNEAQIPVLSDARYFPKDPQREDWDGEELYILLSSYNAITGADKGTLTALNNFFELAKPVLEKHPSLASILRRALPSNIKDYLMVALQIIPNLDGALPSPDDPASLQRFQNALIQHSAFTKHDHLFNRSSVADTVRIAIHDPITNPSTLNYLPLAAAHYTTAYALIPQGDLQKGIAAALDLTRLFEQGLRFRIQERFLNFYIQAMNNFASGQSDTLNRLLLAQHYIRSFVNEHKSVEPFIASSDNGMSALVEHVASAIQLHHVDPSEEKDLLTPKDVWHPVFTQPSAQDPLFGLDKEQLLALPNSAPIFAVKPSASAEVNFSAAPYEHINPSPENWTALEERMALAVTAATGLRPDSPYTSNVHVVGGLGVGKTTLFETVRRIMASPEHVCRLFGPNSTPQEISGITMAYPRKDKTPGVFPICPPDMYKAWKASRKNPKNNVLIILDEVASTDINTQAGFLSIDHAPGGLDFSSGIILMAASNPPINSEIAKPKIHKPSDTANDLIQPLRRRLPVIPLEPGILDDRPIDLVETFDRFLARNADVEFVRGEGFVYKHIYWPLPQAPSVQMQHKWAIYWSIVMNDFTNKDPNWCKQLGVADDTIAPYDTPASRAQLVNMLTNVSAVGGRLASKENIRLLMRGAIGRAAGDALFSHWLSMEESGFKFEVVESIIAQADKALAARRAAQNEQATSPHLPADHDAKLPTQKHELRLKPPRQNKPHQQGAGLQR